MKKSTLFILVLLGIFIISSAGVVISAVNSEPNPVVVKNTTRPLSKAINALADEGNYTVDINFTVEYILNGQATTQELSLKIKQSDDVKVMTINSEGYVVDYIIISTSKTKKTYYVGVNNVYDKVSETEKEMFEMVESLDILVSQNIKPKNFTLKDDVYYGNLDKLSSGLQAYTCLVLGVENADELQDLSHKVDAFSIKLLDSQVHTVDMASTLSYHECELGETVTIKITGSFDYSRIGTTRISLPTNLPE